MVVFTNFRVDRAKQLAQYIQIHAEKHTLITAVPYPNVASHVLHKPTQLQNYLLKVLSDHNKTVLSIAETEKLAHISTFSTEEIEEQLKHVTQICIPSKKKLHMKIIPRCLLKR